VTELERFDTRTGSATATKGPLFTLSDPDLVADLMASGLAKEFERYAVSVIVLAGYVPDDASTGVHDSFTISPGR
jgi:hypothetical protein